MSHIDHLQQVSSKASAYKEILKELESHPRKLVLAGGIVNPFGPTFAAVLLLGEQKRGSWDLYRLTLNPFMQELTRLRAAKVTEATSPSSVIGELGLIAAPTILFFGSLSDEEVYACAHEMAARYENFGPLVDRLRKFAGDPWKRVAEEQREADEVLAAAGKQAKPARQVTEKDMQDYFLLIIDAKNFQEELTAFFTAWNGSIDFQRSSGNLEIVETAMPADEADRAIKLLIS